jgi:hypothetical protein
MNAAAELLDSLHALLPQSPAPVELVGKVVRRGFETFEVLGYDEQRQEFELENASGRTSIRSAAWFYQKVIREVQPRVKPRPQPQKEKVE